jgi:hypothetical protein
MANLGQKDFSARIKRIESPRNTSYYDPDLKMHVPKHTSQEAIRKSAKARKFSVVKLLVSLLIGVAAVMIGQAIRLRFLGMTEPGNALLATDLLLAAFFMLLISALMRHRKLSLRLCQVVGVAAMIVGGHNLMWFYPNELAIIYTSDYVAQMRAQTEPLSLVFRDMAISL